MIKETPGHTSLINVPAVSATEESDGNIEYWYCEYCGKYYADAECTQEITLADTVVKYVPEENQGGNEEPGDNENPGDNQQPGTSDDTKNPGDTEKPSDTGDDSKTSETPKTGDEGMMAFLLILMTSAAAGGVVWKKRRNSQL